MFGNRFLLKLTGEQSKTNDISRLFQLISLNSWVFNFASHDKDLSFGDFQAELLSFETLIDEQTNLVIDQHSAFSTNQKGKPPVLTRKLKLKHLWSLNCISHLMVKIKTILLRLLTNLLMTDDQSARFVIRKDIMLLTIITVLTFFPGTVSTCWYCYNGCWSQQFLWPTCLVYGQWSKCSYHYQCREFNQPTRVMILSKLAMAQI